MPWAAADISKLKDLADAFMNLVNPNPDDILDVFRGYTPSEMDSVYKVMMGMQNGQAMAANHQDFLNLIAAIDAAKLQAAGDALQQRTVFNDFIVGPMATLVNTAQITYSAISAMSAKVDTTNARLQLLLDEAVGYGGLEAGATDKPLPALPTKEIYFTLPAVVTAGGSVFKISPVWTADPGDASLIIEFFRADGSQIGAGIRAIVNNAHIMAAGLGLGYSCWPNDHPSGVLPEDCKYVTISEEGILALGTGSTLNYNL